MDCAVRGRFSTGALGRACGSRPPALGMACRFLIACLPVVIAGAVQPVFAQQLPVPAAVISGIEQDPAPPVSAPVSLTLSDAVRLTLAHSTAIWQSRETLRFDQGRHRELSGAFDPLLTFLPSLSLSKHPLFSSIAASEVQKRATLQLVANEFSALSQALNDQIALRPTAAAPLCPSGLRVALTQSSSQPLLGLFQQSAPATSPRFDFSDVCSAAPDALVPPAVYQRAWTTLNQSGSLGLQSALQTVDQIQLDTLTVLSQNAQTVATRAALALQQLGVVPTNIRQSSASVDVSLFKLFRNGITLGGDITLASQEENYAGKPLDVASGGSGLPPQFTLTTQATLEVPLARGRGRTAVDAPEHAAEQTVLGDRDRLHHDVSTEVFRTIVSYLNLIAAQQQVRLFEESVARQRQIAGLVESAVANGIAAAMERTRAQASAAVVDAEFATVRATVVSAGVGLANTIGVDLNDATPVPVAGQQYSASKPALAPVDELIRQALAMRRDVRALERDSEAAALLAAGARANLRPQINLSLQAGSSTLYDTPSLRFSSPVGYYRSFTAPWAPFAAVSLSFELPFGNRSAKGRLVQAESTFNESRIRSRDLQRVISQNVIDAADAVRRAAEALERWDAAVAAATQTLDAAIQRFQLGDLTLIDVLLTEQELTNDLQQQITLQQTSLSALARLGFETGGLMRFENEGTPNESLTFDSAAFVREP
jgi:outer membrane protein TolC